MSSKESVISPEAPKAVGPYSHARWAGDLLYLSGQVGPGMGRCGENHRVPRGHGGFRRSERHLCRVFRRLQPFPCPSLFSGGRTAPGRGRGDRSDRHEVGGSPVQQARAARRACPGSRRFKPAASSRRPGRPPLLSGVMETACCRSKRGSLQRGGSGGRTGAFRGKRRPGGG